jgi:hypothetical protein
MLRKLVKLGCSRSKIKASLLEERKACSAVSGLPFEAFPENPFVARSANTKQEVQVLLR